MHGAVLYVRAEHCLCIDCRRNDDPEDDFFWGWRTSRNLTWAIGIDKPLIHLADISNYKIVVAIVDGLNNGGVDVRNLEARS
jgi:hypothetical protein